MKRLKGQFELPLDRFTLKVEFDWELDQTTVIFGPSGCGKTTFLRCLAGLEPSVQGYLNVGGDSWQTDKQFVPAHRRPVGFVFQDARLFPHLTVEGNLEYGRKRAGPINAALNKEEIVELLQIKNLSRRKPATLSAGEAQRVALARTLLRQPKLILMDEPLANLDSALKEEILPFLSRIRKNFHIPLIYVSHSMSEALQLVDALVFIEQGKIINSGPAEELISDIRRHNKLEDTFSGGILDTRVVRHEPEYGLTQLDYRGQNLFVPEQNLAMGSMRRVHLWSRDVSVSTVGPSRSSSLLNTLRGKIVKIDEKDGEQFWVDVLIDIGDPLIATITRKSLHTLDLQPGQAVFAQIKALKILHE